MRFLSLILVFFAFEAFGVQKSFKRQGPLSKMGPGEVRKKFEETIERCLKNIGSREIVYSDNTPPVYAHASKQAMKYAIDDRVGILKARKKRNYSCRTPCSNAKTTVRNALFPLREKIADNPSFYSPKRVACLTQCITATFMRYEKDSSEFTNKTQFIGELFQRAYGHCSEFSRVHVFISKLLGLRARPSWVHRHVATKVFLPKEGKPDSWQKCRRESDTDCEWRIMEPQHFKSKCTLMREPALPVK